jgi:hypothetical protein
MDFVCRKTLECLGWKEELLSPAQTLKGFALLKAQAANALGLYFRKMDGSKELNYISLVKFETQKNSLALVRRKKVNFSTFQKLIPTYPHF